MICSEINLSQKYDKDFSGCLDLCVFLSRTESSRQGAHWPTQLQINYSDRMDMQNPEVHY